MNISTEYKKIIAEEFRYSAKMMKATEFADKKLFFFSSTYGVLSRIFNLQYDPQLVFAHFILNSSYASINSRISSIKSGDVVIDFPAQGLNKLAEAVEEFADKIEQGQSIFEVLQKIVEISFISTGNGFYLFQKGILKL